MAELTAKQQEVFDDLTTLNYLVNFPKDRKAMERVARVVAAFVDVARQSHPELGEVSPLEWLVDELGSSCRFFPPAIQIRQVYEQRFPPLDKRQSASMLAALEGLER